jgi:hypothetical protein
MGRISWLLGRTIRQLAMNPRVQAKASEVMEKEVKPRAQEAWRQAKPRLDAAKEELRHLAAETDPRKSPKEFAARVKERFFKRRS